MYDIEDAPNTALHWPILAALRRWSMLDLDDCKRREQTHRAWSR